MNDNALAVKYRQSPQSGEIIEQLEELTEGINPEAKSAREQASYPTHFCYQVHGGSGNFVF